MKHALTILALLTLVPVVWADVPSHPFILQPETSLQNLKGSSLLEWGPSTLGFSQSWYGGRSRSQGYLLKEFRSQLHPSLEFKARFGMSFQPGAMNGSEDGKARFEIPEASLTWRPGGNTTISLHFQQGSLWQNSPYSMGSSLYDPWRNRFDPFAETP